MKKYSTTYQNLPTAFFKLKKLVLALVLLTPFTLFSQTTLFQDDFGTSYSGTKLLSSWCSASSYANSSIGCVGYGWYAYGSNDYIKSNNITIPATGTTTLTFDYKFDKFGSYPTVSISTSGCYGSYTTVKTLSWNSSCFSESLDLSAYAGQTINIQFKTFHSSGTFVLDNVLVENTAGGGGADFKWADNFNDNNLNLDYAGNDGNEQLSGQSWNIGTGALVPQPYTQTVNYNKSEAFPASETHSYSIELDEGEYFESPTMDLSNQEALKISFYVDKSGGSFSDWIGSHIYLQIWNGSSWVQVLSLGGSTGDDENLLASGFGYHCFTAYKSATSPGNYSYNSLPNVNSSLFNSNFKYRIEIQGWGNIKVHVDNVTFRAGNDGKTVVPCGISYWNAPAATYYGKDVDATSTDHSKRGVEVEIDDLWNIGTPPDWAGHCNDGNTGTSSAGFYTMFAVISEQEITNNTYTKLYYTNGTSNNNPNMFQDNSYAGPGYLYYYRLYTGCNNEPGSYDPKTNLKYAFWFDYGLNMSTVYYQLNLSGIEKGGGVTAASEYLIPGIACLVVLPIKLLHFSVQKSDNEVFVSWKTASEINNDFFIIERSSDGVEFEPIGKLIGAGTQTLN